MTNYERIKALSIDDMAKFMFEMVDCVSCETKLKRNMEIEKCHGDGRKCLTVTKKWLESKSE